MVLKHPQCYGGSKYVLRFEIQQWEGSLYSGITHTLTIALVYRYLDIIYVQSCNEWLVNLKRDEATIRNQGGIIVIVS